MTDSLSSLTADEFFDVYREFFPNATRSQFETDWDEFQQAKSLHLTKLHTN